MSSKRTAMALAKRKGRKNLSRDGARRANPWETPFRLMRQGITDKLAEEGALVYYHLRHSCGHTAYWTDPFVGMRCTPWPCPWCGAATGETFPPNEATIDYGDGCFVSREKPTHHPSGGPVLIQHMYNEYCCTGRGDPFGSGEAVHLE